MIRLLLNDVLFPSSPFPLFLPEGGAGDVMQWWGELARAFPWWEQVNDFVVPRLSCQVADDCETNERDWALMDLCRCAGGDWLPASLVMIAVDEQRADAVRNAALGLFRSEYGRMGPHGLAGAGRILSVIVDHICDIDPLCVERIVELHLGVCGWTEQSMHLADRLSCAVVDAGCFSGLGAVFLRSLAALGRAAPGRVRGQVLSLAVGLVLEWCEPVRHGILGSGGGMGSGLRTALQSLEAAVGLIGEYCVERRWTRACEAEKGVAFPPFGQLAPVTLIFAAMRETFPDFRARLGRLPEVLGQIAAHGVAAGLEGWDEVLGECIEADVAGACDALDVIAGIAVGGLFRAIVRSFARVEVDPELGFDAIRGVLESEPLAIRELTRVALGVHEQLRDPGWRALLLLRVSWMVGIVARSWPAGLCDLWSNPPDLAELVILGYDCWKRSEEGAFAIAALKAERFALGRGGEALETAFAMLRDSELRGAAEEVLADLFLCDVGQLPVLPAGELVARFLACALSWPEEALEGVAALIAQHMDIGGLSVEVVAALSEWAKVACMRARQCGTWRLIGGAARRGGGGFAGVLVQIVAERIADGGVTPNAAAWALHELLDPSVGGCVIQPLQLEPIIVAAAAVMRDLDPCDFWRLLRLFSDVLDRPAVSRIAPAIGLALAEASSRAIGALGMLSAAGAVGVLCMFGALVPNLGAVVEQVIEMRKGFDEVCGLLVETLRAEELIL